MTYENIDIDQPFLATPAQLRALPNWRKRPIIRGKAVYGTQWEHSVMNNLI
jgi:hypothetical protein